MRIPEDRDYLNSQKESPKRIPALGWYYRSNGTNGDEALDLALRAIKRLKTWQRMTYGKPPTEPADEVKLPARGTLEDFTIGTGALFAALKSYGKKVYLELAGYLFPAATLAEICKVSGNEHAQLTIDPRHAFPVYDTGSTKYPGETKNPSDTKYYPALVMTHGNAVQAIRGMLAGSGTPADYQVIPCTI